MIFARYTAPRTIAFLLLILTCAVTFAQPSQVWSTFIQPSDPTAVEAAVDAKVAPNGRTYVTGVLRFLNGDQPVSTSVIDPSGQVLWTNTYGAAGESHFGYRVSYDSQGNCYVLDSQLAGAGSFSNVLKYSPTGALLWVRTLGGPGVEYDALSLSVDSADNIVVCTQVSGYTDVRKYDPNGNQVWDYHLLLGPDFSGACIGPDDSLYVLGSTAESQPKASIDKISSAGALTWERHYQYDPIASNDNFSAAAIDASNNVYLIGHFGNPNTSDNLNGVVKYDSAGNFQWIQRFGKFGTGSQFLNIVIDNANNVFAVGQNRPVSDSDGYTVKLDSSGVTQWAKAFSDTGTPQNENVEFAVPDNLGGVYSGVVSSRGDGICYYDTDGNTVWPNSGGNFDNGCLFQSSGTSQHMATLGMDSAGDLYIGGQAVPTGGSHVEQFAAKFSANPQLSSISLSPTAALPGALVTGTVTISTPAPFGGQPVSLSAPGGTIPSTVTIPMGTTSTTFQVSGSNSTYTDVPITVSATVGVVTKTATLIVHPNNRSTFISQSVPTTMVCGQSYPVSLQFKNTGGVTWDTAHTYQLGSANAYNNSNFGMNRIPLTSGSVAPGATGTFSATVFGPSTPGTYNFQWQMYQQSNNMFFGQASTGISVVVTSSADASQYVSRTGATSVVEGLNFYVQNTFKNVGTTTWSTGTGYSMMPVNPVNNPIWGLNRRGYLSSGTVAPGSSGVFTATCTAPSSPGTYTMQWQMDKSSSPFGDTSPLLTITVTGNNTNNATYVSETSIPTSVAAGVQFGATFTMHNSGTTTWSGSYALESIGNNNFGVASTAVSGSIVPGADGTFTTTFTAPSIPGTYTFQRRMTTGSTQFGQPTPGFTITVSSGDAAVYVSRTGTLTIAAGRDFYIQNTMMNTGTTSWSSPTGYSMMTVNPNNDPTWTVTRAYLPSGTIAPGGSGTFNANCTAPIIAGAYFMQWQMDKNGTPFGETTPLLCIFVYQGADDAQFVSQSGIPSTIAHGAAFTPTVTMKNVGTGTWNGSYSLASIGSNNFGVASIASTSVGPNGTKAFSATFTAPATPGTYTFKMRMQNGSTKFGQASTQVTITVT